MARMRFTLVAATATIAALAAPTTAAAATTSCDGLQQALESSTPNSVVTLVDDEVCVGQWTLPEHPITFEGGTGVATLSGEDKLQILRGFNVGTTTIRNLTFIDGLASEDEGGAIQLEGDSPAIIQGNEFFSNRTEDGGSGGAVSYELDNQVATVNARGLGAPIVLRGNTFGGPGQGNVSDDEGGAVFIDAFFRQVIVEDNTFADNVADEAGGGLSVSASQSITLAGNDFLRNEAGEEGGGATIDTCTAEITANLFDSNRLTQVEDSLTGGGLLLSGNVCRNAQGLRGAAPVSTQSDNDFVDNTINGRFSVGIGAGEAIDNLEVISTSDRFVGNTIDGTEAGVGGGLASIGSRSQPLIARNLVAAGNEITPEEQEAPARGKGSGLSAGGGVFLAGNGESTFRIADSTVEANTAELGSGIAGGFFRAGELRGGGQADALVVENSIVFDNTGAAEEIFGFGQRDVRSTDTCEEGDVPHPDGDGAAPNSNVCVAPALAGDKGDENVDQTSESPTIDAGDNALVDTDLTEDYAGDGRVLDGDGNGTATVDMGADEYKPVTPEPTPEETVPPATQPAPQGAVQGQTQRSCKSKRVFRIRIRVPRGKKARSATVRVNNKKVKVVRGKRLRAPVRLRGLPKGRFTVRITVRLTNGKKITGKRVYNTCIPRLPGDGPPKV